VKAYLFTFAHGEVRKSQVDFDPKTSYVDGEYPIDDYGDYYLSFDDLTIEQAELNWLRYLETREEE